MTAIVTTGDARSLPFPDDSIDLVITSPPYFGLRSYTDGGEHYAAQIGSESTPREFIAALVDCTREMARVLKPSGSIFVNLGDKYSGAQGQTQTGAVTGRREALGGSSSSRPAADPRRSGIPAKSLMLLPERYRIACVDELGLIARAVLVWSKPNGLPESVRDRVRRSHEEWVHLTKSPRYFEAVDEIREPARTTVTPGGGTRYLRVGESATGAIQGRNVRVRGGEQGMHGDRPAGDNPLGKLPGSVWSIATQPLRVPPEVVHAACCGGTPVEGCTDGIEHFAAFPMEWPRRLITGWCPPDGVVLDPFGGTGTTALVADVLGRTGINLDASGDYGRIAQWRTADPVERARAAGNDTSLVARSTLEQGDLFAGAAS